MFFNFFKKKTVVFLGRSGMIFTYQGYKYYVDSEMAFSKNIDIVVYKDSVRFEDRTKSIDESQKADVLSSLLKYLRDEERLKVEVI